MLQQIDIGGGAGAVVTGLAARMGLPAWRGAADVADEELSALPFTVRVVSTDAELLAVQSLRELAYGRHLPALKASFGLDDPLDRAPGTTLFLAEDKLTGEVVGAARIQTNRHAPLQIEGSVALPAAYRRRHLAEITRLTVLPGYGGPVRLALVKASHLFCIGMQIGAVLAGSRQSLLRSYRMLGFLPLLEDGAMVPLRHAGGLPHHVLVRDMVTAEAESRARSHSAHQFVFCDFHPEIDVFGAVHARVDAGLRNRPAAH